MDKTTCCPKCNYRDKSESGFAVCPRCGLIITKYLEHQNKSESVVKTADEIPPTQVHPQAPSRFYLKKIFLSVLSIVIIIGALRLIRNERESGSGVILWSQTSAEPFRPNSIAIDKNYLYVVGVDNLTDFKNWHWRMEKRRLTDGALVSEFGNNGVVTAASGEHFFAPIGVAIQSEYLYLIGYESIYQMIDARWRIEKRRASDGALVTDFGDGGVVVSEQPRGFKRPQTIALDADYMYVGGNEDVFPDPHSTPLIRYQSRIEKRRLTDGMLVPGFGAAGVAMGDTTTGGGVVFAGARITMDSKFMYVSGAVNRTAPYDTEWRIEKRRLSDGSYCHEFGDNGIVKYNPSPGFDDAHGIAIDEQYMYVVGHDMSSGSTIDQQWHIEKRRLSDGALADDFGNNGIVTNNPSNRVDWASAIVIDREKPGLWERILTLDPFWERRSMYVVGKDEIPGVKDQEWRIEKRRLSDGSTVRTFGNFGVVSINPSKYFESAYAIASDADYIYVAGDDSSLGVNEVHSSIVKIKK
jgi:hypothetical protein